MGAPGPQDPCLEVVDRPSLVGGGRIRVVQILATGDPASEVTAAADREHCDLIAMATHGHKLIGDVIHGSVANSVRHKSMVPVLLVRAPGKPAA